MGSSRLTPREILSRIKKGSLHRVHLNSGRVDYVYISSITSHNDWVHSFFGWYYSDKRFSNGDSIKCGRYYWIENHTWDGVINIEPLEDKVNN